MSPWAIAVFIIILFLNGLIAIICRDEEDKIPVELAFHLMLIEWLLWFIIVLLSGGF